MKLTRDAFFAMQELARKYGHTWGYTPLDSIADLTVQSVAEATIAKCSSSLRQGQEVGILAPAEQGYTWSQDKIVLGHTTYGRGTAWRVEATAGLLTCDSDIYRLRGDERILALRLVITVSADAPTQMAATLEIDPDMCFYVRHILTCVNNMQTLLTGVLRCRNELEEGLPIVAELMESVYIYLMENSGRIDEVGDVRSQADKAELAAQDAEALARAARYKANALHNKVASLVRVPDAVLVSV